MATDGQLKFRADGSLHERVGEYENEYSHDSRSDALRELVEVGLREQQHPLVYRAKDRVLEWVNLLSIAAVVVFALGTTTDVLTFADGVIAALYMLALATAFLGAFEFARFVAAMNEVGVRARRVMGSVATVVGKDG